MISDALLSAETDLDKLTTTLAVVGDGFYLGAPADQGLIATTYGPAFVVTVVGADGGTSVEVEIITSANANLSAPTVMATSGTLTPDAAGNVQHVIPVPSGDWKAYGGVRAKATGTFTDGTLRVEYTANARQWRAYPAETGR